MDTKTVFFANFNVTFDDEGMLTYFPDVIYPAFRSELSRGKEGTYPIFSFSDVHLEEDADGDLILVGFYVKDTEYEVHTTREKGKLVSAPANIPTSPYSRFIIFLKNHRMILIKNENPSPDIRSFQATVRKILGQYIHIENSRRKKTNEKEMIPIANVNIVDMPLTDSIASVLSSVEKMNTLRLNFFKLNNDNDPNPISKAIRGEMADIRSETANLVFNSPQSKEGVQRLYNETIGLGLARTYLVAEDTNGEPMKIKDDSFSSSMQILVDGDVDERDDANISKIVKRNPALTIVSEDNLNLFRRMEKRIRALLTL